MVFDDNSNCHVTHKHHHSSKNLSSVTNSNSRNVSEDYGDSKDFEEADSGSGRTAAVGEEFSLCIISNGNVEGPLLKARDSESLNAKGNSFYYFSLGNMAAEPASHGSINCVSTRPSFYSDPTTQRS